MNNLKELWADKKIRRAIIVIILGVLASFGVTVDEEPILDAVDSISVDK